MKGLKMATRTITIKAYIKNGKLVKTHKRTLPDKICSNNRKPKLCKRK